METDKLLLISPTELKEEEISRPMSVIVSLFDQQASEYFKKNLWEMLKAVLSEYSWTYLNAPATALNLERDFGRLIDALWLILYEKERQEGEIELPEQTKEPEEQRHHQTMELMNLYPALNLHKGRIRRLSVAETENPLIAVKSFFQFQTRQHWKEMLAQWKEYTLTNASLIESHPDQEFITKYEHLEKMIEVAYLFNKQSESKFYAEDELYLEGLINEINSKVNTSSQKR